jgi:hypothetical protein
VGQGALDETGNATAKLTDALDLLVAFYAPEITQRGVDR